MIEKIPYSGKLGVTRSSYCRVTVFVLRARGREPGRKRKLTVGYQPVAFLPPHATHANIRVGGTLGPIDESREMSQGAATVRAWDVISTCC